MYIVTLYSSISPSTIAEKHCYFRTFEGAQTWLAEHGYCHVRDQYYETKNHVQNMAFLWEPMFEEDKYYEDIPF